MEKSNIMVVTTSRADYGLLSPLIEKIEDHDQMNLQLVVTGSHLSHHHGRTIDLIKADNRVSIAETVEMTGTDDTEHAVCDSIASGLSHFSKTLLKLNPDLLIVLGDRYELWSACMAAIIHKVPIAHIHGGESTIGAIDETIRHSITKMSAFHFTAIDQYAKRIVQMGENPDRVFVVGAIGLDNIVSTPLMSIDELSKFSGVDFKKNVALMTYHPVTLDHYNSAEHQIQEILSTLLKTNLTVLMTMPNADTSGQIIYRFVQSFSKKYPEQFTLVKSLGQKAYLSAMQHSKLMIGNSSSGIIESASFKLPVVNVGDRQKGRVRTSNVIDCDCSQNAIRHAIDLALSDGFKTSISLLQSPYGDGKASDRIVKIIETIDFKDNRSIIEKKFFDLLFNDSDINLGKNI